MSTIRASSISAAGAPAAFRVWNKVDNWCSLCKEPFGQWNEHRGKRDHICLEMFFEAVLDYRRLWAPGTVWATFERDYKRHSMVKLFAHHDRDESVRRSTALHMLKFLKHEGVIFPAPVQWRDPLVAKIGAGQQGALVMYKWMHPHILNLFPTADAKQISALSQMCASMYNLETTFDVCGMKELIGPGDLPATPTGEPAELDYAHKAFILRHVLGQLRWAMDVDVAIPKYHTVAHRCPPHVAVVAEKAGHALITDMIFCRVCEYVSRVENVWREQAALFDSEGTFMAHGQVDTTLHDTVPHPRHQMHTPRYVARMARSSPWQ